MQYVESVVDAVLAQLARRQAGEAPLPSLGAALQVRDAAMLAMTVGHVGLALRLSIVRTLRAARFAHAPCTAEGCTLAGCHGNRLEAVPQPAGEPVVYELVVPHHKTACRAVAMPVMRIYSDKLNQLLRVWQEHGRAVLVRANPGAANCMELFLNNQANPYTEALLGTW
jgi:hypothetical protein